MKWRSPSLGIVVAVLFVGAGILIGRELFGGGVPPKEVAKIARATGDSAVTAYRKDVEAIVPALRDSVKFYKAEARVAARVVVERDTVRITDTITVTPVVDTVTGVQRIPFPSYQDRGITLAETLSVHPPIPDSTQFTRRIVLGFDPDSLSIALLRLPNGLDRITTHAEGMGISTSVLNAAQKPPPSSGTLETAWGAARVGGCVATGWGVAEENELVVLAGGVICLLGLLVGG